MTIQFNTDKNINGNEEFTAPYVAQIEDKLSRYSDISQDNTFWKL
jgi:hypothetical protein